MTYPIKLFCKCGAKLEHKAQTQASADQYADLWKRGHIGQGHELINELEYRRVRKAVGNER